ncbi:MAG: 5-(carboxyamino)imidazole ribonucleotide synthase [Armatimonadaceae bacterium]
MVHKPILPGATIGILGSGQLGRMLAIVARRMGYRVHVLSPSPDSPAGQVADWEITAGYNDLSAVRDLAMSVDVITFEFENIPNTAAELATQFVPVRPHPSVLQVTQNRLREKTFLKNRGFPVTPFAPVGGYSDLLEAVQTLSLPMVLKTSGFGYDGKGQQILQSLTDLEDVSTELGRTVETVMVPGAATPHYVDVPRHIVEKFVDYSCELSVVAARGMDGSFAHYGAVRNDHVNHILDVTTAPAAVEPEIAARAVELARGVLEALDVVGVMCVELFLTSSGELLINELAPRPHNSGHWTIEGCPTSQFEQQLRAICGLPLGDTTPYRPAAMANLLGALWAQGEPNWQAALAFEGVALHLYSKAGARQGRKMGHLTVLADTAEDAENRVRQARAALTPQFGKGETVTLFPPGADDLSLSEDDREANDNDEADLPDEAEDATREIPPLHLDG